jgi:ribosomal protein L33
MESFEKMIASSVEGYEKKLSERTPPLDPSQRPAFDNLQAKLELQSEAGSHSAEESDKHSAHRFGEIRQLACLAQTLSAYLITVNSKRNNERLKAITVKLYDAVNLWLSRLFRYLLIFNKSF